MSSPSADTPDRRSPCDATSRASIGDVHVPNGLITKNDVIPSRIWPQLTTRGGCMFARKVTLTAIVAVAAMAVAIGQAREGAQGRGGAAGRQGGGPPPAQLKIEMVKPGLYAI